MCAPASGGILGPSTHCRPRRNTNALFSFSNDAADHDGTVRHAEASEMKGAVKRRSTRPRARAIKRRWSAQVTRRSNALDLEPSVFKSRDPRRIAQSLKRSAESSKRRKGTPYQSAMSMLNLYINRSGRNLPATQKRLLQRAKGELRSAFGRV
jgi:hypothetical protein